MTVKKKSVVQMIKELERKFLVSESPKRLGARVVEEKMTANFRVEPIDTALTDQVTPAFSVTAGTAMNLLQKIRREKRERQIGRTIYGLEEFERIEGLKHK